MSQPVIIDKKEFCFLVFVNLYLPIATYSSCRISPNHLYGRELPLNRKV